jgi:hypothetical protein
MKYRIGDIVDIALGQVLYKKMTITGAISKINRKNDTVENTYYAEDKFDKLKKIPEKDIKFHEQSNL